ncbi:MAG: hypothetical protein ACE5I9_10650 [Candidatus Methylomirabilales bacterium]
MISYRPGWCCVLAGVVLLCLLLLAGCVTGRALEGLYVDESRGFRVRLPREGWGVMESEGANLALQDSRSPARMAVSVSCPESETGPLPALARHLLFGLREVKLLRQGAILLDGVPGLETLVTGRWKGAPVQIWSVVIRRKGCLYDLLFVATPETFGARSEDFDRFLENWQFLSEQP